MVRVANELHDSWVLRRVLGAPRDVSTAYENKAGSHISWWFSDYSNTFHPKYLQTKPYESISMTVQIMGFFVVLWILFAFSIGQGKNQTREYASIRLEGSFGSMLGWDHTALVEKNLFLCTVPRGTALAS